ncbi:MAG: hypothetical protein QNK24_04230 [Desulfuromusa sp.]|nr:hypothetical protein [Desulfuromusa sp.]
MRFLSLLILLLFACSATVITPQPQSASLIDIEDQRISQTTRGVQLPAKLLGAGIRPSLTDQNYCSFWAEVTNQRNGQLPIDFTDFLLIDDQGRQYLPANHAELVEQLTDAVPCLTPYPYIVFYYLGDSVRSQADTQFRSKSNILPLDDLNIS